VGITHICAFETSFSFKRGLEKAANHQINSLFTNLESPLGKMFKYIYMRFERYFPSKNLQLACCSVKISSSVVDT